MKRKRVNNSVWERERVGVGEREREREGWIKQIQTKIKTNKQT